MRVLLIALLLTGCVSTAAKIITAPVRIVGAGIDTAVDATTTTQREADEDRGRALRKQEERDRKAAKQAEKERQNAIRRSD